MKSRHTFGRLHPPTSMSEEKPLVSIVTITLESEKHIAAAVGSVLAQTYPNIEHIVVDGGSTDSTLARINELSPPNLRLIQEKDEGIADAMNKGIRAAQGEFVGILHSDDVYLPHAVERSLERLVTTGASWSYGRMLYVDQEGTNVLEVGRPYSAKLMKRFMLPGFSTIFCRRSLYEQIGEFDLRYQLAMDYDLFLRAALREDPIFIDEILAKMRLGGASSASTGAKIQAAYEALEIKQKHLPNRRFTSRIYFLWVASKTLLAGLLETLRVSPRFRNRLRSLVNPNYASAPRSDEK